MPRMKEWFIALDASVNGDGRTGSTTFRVQNVSPIVRLKVVPLEINLSHQLQKFDYMESKHLCPIASHVTQTHVHMQLRPVQHTAQALAERNVQWSLGTCVSVTLTRPRLKEPGGFHATCLLPLAPGMSSWHLWLDF